MNLSQIIKSGEDAIKTISNISIAEAAKKISNISGIAEAAEQVIEDAAAEILNIIPNEETEKPKISY